VTKLSRRSFLKQTSATAATLSLVPALPALAAFSHSPEAGVKEWPAPLTGSMVAHVSDVASGEITLFWGDKEIVFRDAQTVARLIRAAR